MLISYSIKFHSFTRITEMVRYQIKQLETQSYVTMYKFPKWQTSQSRSFSDYIICMYILYIYIIYTILYI